MYTFLINSDIIGKVNVYLASKYILEHFYHFNQFIYIYAIGGLHKYVNIAD